MAVPDETNVEGFSFRWGVVVPRGARHGQIVYDFLLRTYTRLGLRPAEFALMLHLAAYHYDTAYGRSQPSLVTIALQMGRKPRSIRRMIASLEAKGVLEITPESGGPNIYNARPFAEKALALWDYTPGQERQRTKKTPPPLPETSAETKRVKHQAPAATYSINPRWREIRQLLAEDAIVDPHSPTQRAHLSELFILCESYEVWSEAVRRAKRRDPNASLALVEHILRQAVREGCFDHDRHDWAQWLGILRPDPWAKARAEAAEAAEAAAAAAQDVAQESAPVAPGGGHDA